MPLSARRPGDGAQAMTRNCSGRIARLAALVVVLLAGVGAGSRPPVTSHGRPGAQFATGGPVTVFGPVQLVHTSSSSTSWVISDAAFTADSVNGWRYCVNINTSASSVIAAIAAVNDTQWVGASQYGGTLNTLSQPVRVIPGQNVLTMQMRGTQNSAITYSVTRVQDPTFRVLKDTTLVRPGTIAPQTLTFTVPAGGGPPYSLRLRNGAPNGGNRLTSGTVTLNNVGVLGNADLGTGVAYQERNVNLHVARQLDTLTLLNQSAASTRATLWVTATDLTPPVMHIAWPPQNYVTARDTVHFAGWTTDETYGLTSVNGQNSRLGPGAFVDSLSFTSDGPHAVHVVSTNAAGLTTDSVRTVTRARAPVLAITQPAASITTTSTGSITLAGTWTAVANVTVTVNGDAVTSGTPTGSSRNRAPCRWARIPSRCGRPIRTGTPRWSCAR